MQLKLIILVSYLVLATVAGRKHSKHEVFTDEIDRLTAHLKHLLDVPTNISQTEYYSKHISFHKRSRRNTINANKAAGIKYKRVPRNLINEFTPVDAQSLDRNTDEFTYHVNLPIKNRRVVDSELRFMIIPGKCSRKPRQVTFSVMDQEEVTLDVDACDPRWDSIRIQSLKLKSQTVIKVHCIDCADQYVTYSAPYLNIITSSKPRIKMIKRGMIPKHQHCNLHELDMVFGKISMYAGIVSPSHINLGICKGTCVSPLHAHSGHTLLHYALFRKRKVDQRPCCAPYEYQTFEFLYKNGSKLGQDKWIGAEVLNCSCQ